MELEPVLIVFFLFVLFPAVLMRGVARMRAAKQRAGSQGSGELGASELRALIRAAVEEAVQPLSHRVADLEERLGDESVASLRARLDPAVIAAAIEDDRDPEAPTAVRERVR